MDKDFAHLSPLLLGNAQCIFIPTKWQSDGPTERVGGVEVHVRSLRRSNNILYEESSILGQLIQVVERYIRCYSSSIIETITIQHDPAFQLAAQEIVVRDTIDYTRILEKILPWIERLEERGSKRPRITSRFDWTRKEIFQVRVRGVSYPEGAVGLAIDFIVPMFALVGKRCDFMLGVGALLIDCYIKSICSKSSFTNPADDSFCRWLVSLVQWRTVLLNKSISRGRCLQMKPFPFLD
jgi:hypothetical protein